MPVAAAVAVVTGVGVRLPCGAEALAARVLPLSLSLSAVDKGFSAGSFAVKTTDVSYCCGYPARASFTVDICKQGER